MTLRKYVGNMYDFVGFTYNPIKGKCSHDCVYCYMKRFPQNPIRLDKKDLMENLGMDNTVFVGSSTDMWADDVPDDWIMEVLAKCRESNSNTYLFQSKNPKRFLAFRDVFPSNVLLGTTIETNRENDFTGGQLIRDRAKSMSMLEGFRTFVTIEPIMDFDLDELLFLLKGIQPEFVNIGADSKNHGLSEPSKEKVLELISELNKFTVVRKKSNLDRLL